MATGARTFAVVRRGLVATRAVRRLVVGERPLHPGLGVARGAGPSVGVLGGDDVARCAVARAPGGCRMRERESLARRVTCVARGVLRGGPGVAVRRLVARRTRRLGHVVAARARFEHMPVDVGAALVHRRDAARQYAPIDIGVQDACIPERGHGHLVADVGVATLARPASGVIGVRESAIGDVHILVAPDAALIGDAGLVGQRERRVGGEVRPHLLGRFGFVCDAREGTGIDMAFDAADISMPAARPCVVVGTHLMTRCAAEPRRICGAGDAEGTRKANGERDDHYRRCVHAVRASPSHDAGHGRLRMSSSGTSIDHAHERRVSRR